MISGKPLEVVEYDFENPCGLGGSCHVWLPQIGNGKSKAFGVIVLMGESVDTMGR